MSEILFKTICFEENCNNQTVYKWHHWTCSTSSDEYLNDNGYIICSECGMRSPFFKSRFTCGCSFDDNRRNIGYRRFKKVINFFNGMMMNNEINQDFHYKLLQSLKEQAKKFGLE